MKSLKRYIVNIIICLVLIISSLASVYASVGTYEYNDYYLYQTGGSLVQHNAFRSESDSLSQFYIYFAFDSTHVGGYWSITRGNYSSIPKPNNYSIDVNNVTSNGYVLVNGTRINIIESEDYMIYRTASPITTSGYPNVSVYLPYIAGDTSIPSTPILSINGNQLSWTPTGYNTRILYSDTGQGSYSVLTDQGSSPYTVSQDGFYRVQLWYTTGGNQYITDTSNRVEYTSGSSSGDGTILQRILNFFNNIINGLSNAVSTIGQFIGTLGDLISSIFNWLPSPLPEVFIAVAVIGLVIGLFLK